MSGGAYFMHRGWMDNPVFKQEPYTEREAWVWLIENACYRAERVRSGASIVDLGRGQLIGSVRFLAEAWQWSKNRAGHYLGRLRDTGMIEIGTQSGTLPQVITICNYSRYQELNGNPGRNPGRNRDTSDDETGTQNGTNKKETKNLKKDIGEVREKRPLAIDEPLLEWAGKHNFGRADLECELEKHLLWKREKGKLFKDPRAAFQRWMLNSRAFAAERGGQRSFATQPAPHNADSERERWARRIERWRETGFWLDNWGFPPSDPGCMAPADLLTGRAA